jgi:hypothetical protein
VPGTTPTAPSGTGGTTGAGATTPAGSGAAAGTGSTVGSGVTGTTGSAAGAGGSTGTSAVTGTLGVIPFGSPQTGLGGASHSSDVDLLIPGAVAMIGAGLAMAFAIRRRRSLPVRGSDESS